MNDRDGSAMAALSYYQRHKMFPPMQRIPIEAEYMSNPSDVIDEEEFEESQIDPNSPLKKSVKLEKIIAAAQGNKLNLLSNNDKAQPPKFQRPLPNKLAPITLTKPEQKQPHILSRANSDNLNSKKETDGKSMSAGNQRVITTAKSDQSMTSDSTKPGSAPSSQINKSQSTTTLVN